MKKQRSRIFACNVVPDKLDLRDRMYAPRIDKAPGASLIPSIKPPVLDQKDTSACTGFSLSTMIYILRRRAGFSHDESLVSPFMIYDMARRYDEFPGMKDEGSSLRGAMKGWYKHGVCHLNLWNELKMPPYSNTNEDWWLDAVKRPLGAYYRIDPKSVTDIHSAINEAGAIYASAICHDGWDTLANHKGPSDKFPIIPFSGKTDIDDGGHAFAIIGYTPEGFLIQNSWSDSWGNKGLAVLTYEDFTQNAMDAWVAQLGVVTSVHTELATATSLRLSDDKVHIAKSSELRDREISPFIIDMENNGRLSSTGRFRTRPEDISFLINHHLVKARESWNLKPTDPIDIALYAHGGLTSEEDAALTATKWIPQLYNEKIFPIFLMWETDMLATIKNISIEVFQGQPKMTAGLRDVVKRFWNERLEQILKGPGTLFWNEMKENGDCISNEKGGARILYDVCNESSIFKQNPIRLHLIGHSAGSIVHCHIVDRLAQLGWKFESVNFMAPAATVKLVEKKILPALKDGNIAKLNTFHLTDKAELEDPTCKPILGYSRSLLYLVSNSFEHQSKQDKLPSQYRGVPIFGMEKFFKEFIDRNSPYNIEAFASPSGYSAASGHGAFSSDDQTIESVISLIKKGAVL